MYAYMYIDYDHERNILLPGCTIQSHGLHVLAVNLFLMAFNDLV